MEFMINSDCFNDLERLENYAFSVEKCDNMQDLLLLTKMDFEKECDIKEYLFEKSFENLDCPKLTSCFLRLIVLSQTFNDNFTFVGRTGEIPCSKLWGDASRPVKERLPPCVLAKLRLAMTPFIHKQIMNKKVFSEKTYDSFLQNKLVREFFS